MTNVNTDADRLIDWDGYRDEKGFPLSYLHFFITENPGNLRKGKREFIVQRLPTANLFFNTDVFPLGPAMLNAQTSKIWGRVLFNEVYQIIEKNQPIGQDSNEAVVKIQKEIM